MARHTPPTPAAAGPATPTRGPAPRPAPSRPGRSPPQCATPYADPHRSSLPPSTAPFHSSSGGDPWRAGLIPDRSAVAPLSSHATARARQAGTSISSQATTVGRRFGSQPIGPLKRYDQRRSALQKQLGGYRLSSDALHNYRA